MNRLLTALLVGLISATTAGISAQDAMNLQYVPADAAAVAVAHPRDLMTSPAMELLPREIFSAATIKEIGVDIMEVTQVVAFAMTPTLPNPPDYGLVVRFRNAAVMPRVPGDPLEIAGHRGIQLRGPMAPAIIASPDKKSLLIAPASFLPKMFDAKGPTGTTGAILARAARPEALVAVVDLAKLRPLINAQLQNAPPLPPQLQGLLQLPSLVDAIAVQADTKTEKTNLMFRCVDEPSATKALDVIKAGLAMAKQMGLAQFLQEIEREQDPNMKRAMIAYANRLGDAIEKELTPRQSQSDLRLAAEANYASTGIMVALLLPAVQAAREAARRTQAANQLKQIGLAMHNYHATYNEFPARYSEVGGKPGLSWRVHILPFLDQEPLYRQFHLDEPWDSDHNRKLVAQMPPLYRNPNQSGNDGKTVFLVADGEGVLFDDTKGVPIARIKDGTSNTIMAVEANFENAVIWTKPDDLPFDPKQPLRGLGRVRPGGFQAVLADGSVRFISNSVDQELLRGLFTRAGGETVRIP